MEVTKKKERVEQGQEGKKPEIDPAIIEELMKGYQRPEDLTGPGGIMEQLTKRLYERVLGAEMTHYLGYEKGQAPQLKADQERETHRNGTSKKTIVSEDGKLAIEVPRDRAGEFEPQFIRKGQRRFGGFDSKIIAMYAQGMTVREIKAFLEEQYKVEVSADLISTVTDSIIDDILEWQNRPLERMYPVVFFDALRVKIRDEGTVKNKAVYLALAIRRDGTKEVLGLWIQQSEGSKFWLADCRWKDRRPVALELKGIYNAETAEVAAKRLEDFANSQWGKKLPPIVQSWRRVWEQVIPFFAYPLEIRKIIYTTNAIESLHMQLRKVLKNRGHFPSDEAATKLIYLAIRNITKKWKNPPITWKLAATQFAIQFGERFFAADAA